MAAAARFGRLRWCRRSAALKNSRNCFWIKEMLNGQNAAGEAVGGVARQNRHPLLKDHRTRVEISVHKMNSGAALDGAIVEGLLLRMQAGIFRQQRGMDVEDAIGKRLDEDRT